MVASDASMWKVWNGCTQCTPLVSISNLFWKRSSGAAKKISMMCLFHSCGRRLLSGCGVQYHRLLSQPATNKCVCHDVLTIPIDDAEEDLQTRGVADNTPQIARPEHLSQVWRYRGDYVQEFVMNNVRSLCSPKSHLLPSRPHTHTHTHAQSSTLKSMPKLVKRNCTVEFRLSNHQLKSE